MAQRSRSQIGTSSGSGESSAYFARAAKLKAALEVFMREEIGAQGSLDYQLADFGEFGHAPAVLAIHFAISLNDAVLALAQIERSDRQNHATAVPDLEAACRKLGVDPRPGTKQLGPLMSQKSPIEYGLRAVEYKTVVGACRRAFRFGAWVLRTFEEIERG